MKLLFGMKKIKRGCGLVWFRAPALGAGDLRRFKSRHPHHETVAQLDRAAAF